MAKIIKTNSQLDALNDINKKLKTVSELNDLMKSTNQFFITISSNHRKSKLVVTEQEFQDLISVYRKKYVTDIKKQADRFNIELSETDYNILNNVETKQNDNETSYINEADYQI